MLNDCGLKKLISDRYRLGIAAVISLAIHFTILIIFNSLHHHESEEELRKGLQIIVIPFSEDSEKGKIQSFQASQSVVVEKKVEAQKIEREERAFVPREAKEPEKIKIELKDKIKEKPEIKKTAEIEKNLLEEKVSESVQNSSVINKSDRIIGDQKNGQGMGSGTAEEENNQNSGNKNEASPNYSLSPPPPYPSSARRMGAQGITILSAKISADGEPSEIEIAQTSGFSILDKAAIEAVTKWKFHPAEKNNIPIPSTVKIPIRFSLSGTNR
jgi:periplasmic protein TonB